MVGEAKNVRKVHNPQVCKLGRRYVRRDSRTFALSKYLRPGILPPAPPAVDWTAGVDDWPDKNKDFWPMMLNDKIGDCTCAAAGHMIQCWTASRGSECIADDSDIELAYEAVSGYEPGKPSTDSGAVEIDVLNYWRKTGIAGHKIDAYAAVEVANAAQVKQSVYLFGGLYIGLALPLSAQNQEVWDTTLWGRVTGSAAPGSWGGHAVPILGYDELGLTCITWGAEKRMTWSFFARYCDEAYAPLSQDWINVRGVDPNGFDMATLQKDLQQIAARAA